MYPRQIKALKVRIFKATEVNPLARRIALFLLGESERLTKEVSLTLYFTDGWDVDAIARATEPFYENLNGALERMNTEFCFSVHYGRFNVHGVFDAFGKHGGHPGEYGRCYTFWCARGSFSPRATPLRLTREQFDTVELPAEQEPTRKEVVAK